ncbi:MAG TPA: thiamine-phosphate kinase, partial [Gemmatimonadales bacterium]|nr:thiamine-phosphate kinase [Gemmatimonadales bacterium]
SAEGVHFRLDWISLEEAGYRSTASALSDLAAAGASVTGILAAVTAPRAATKEDLARFMSGVGGAGAQVGGLVLGGDLTAADLWSATITVLGRAARPLRRRGARAGDGLWVTGLLGGARAAVQSWLAGGEPRREARAAFAHPSPRIAAGTWLADAGATAMMDLSDGLAGDAGHLAAASGVALEIELARLPVHPSVPGPDRALFAAAGGEDYELLVTMPGAFSADTASGVPLTRIGTVKAGEGIRLLRDDQVIALPSSYNHFA